MYFWLLASKRYSFTVLFIYKKPTVERKDKSLSFYTYQKSKDSIICPRA
jgi:hypothetical protein